MRDNHISFGFDSLEQPPFGSVFHDIFQLSPVYVLSPVWVFQMLMQAGYFSDYSEREKERQ